MRPDPAAGLGRPMNAVDPELALHGRLCRLACGRWFALHSTLSTLRAWLASRVLSSMLLLALLLGGLTWLLR